MKTQWISATSAVLAMAIVQPSLAGPSEEGPGPAQLGIASQVLQPVAKSASTQTLGTRATVTSSATLYGGFEINTSADVYILIRGNSLGTLGITQGYLDTPRVRVYDRNGADLIFDNSSQAGFNFCTTTGTFSAPVRTLYAARGGASDRDACTAHNFTAGVYTFSVTPSISGVTTTSTQSVPTFGEVLFEVTLNP